MADRPAGNPSSTRSVVHAPNGMVASSQPLASAAGLQMLRQGGNAFDAAVATAAVLAVVEPMQTGIGGDMFALIYNQKNKKVEALNGSGRSPRKATREEYVSRGYSHVPETGILSLTTPGAVDGWAEVLEKHGTMSFEEVLQPAIDYAERGFPVSEIIASQWNRGTSLLQETKEARDTYLIEGKAPREGEIFKNPKLARTLQKIAAGGRDAFYKGDIAKEIAAYVEKEGGLLREEDFFHHTSTWVYPISTTYKGYEMYQIPPNGQGLTTLELLNILENFNFSNMDHNSADYIHLITEAKKLAYADKDHFISDPHFSSAPVEQLLSKEYAYERSQEIDGTTARENVGPGLELVSDTVYLTVADKDRNVISFINSLFTPFGSGIAAGDTGVLLQNRGKGFSLEKGHLNTLEPGKRTLHTIIPALVLKDDKPYMSYGVMGGDMQPQGQVQVLLNHIEYGMNIQEAGEAPRFRHFESGLAVESGISSAAYMGLLDKGHTLFVDRDVFGGFQGILLNPSTGMLQGGSDPRKDGCAIGY
ncbi:gamma-glutamyltransferase [Alteribacillus iranensis]|uniref:Glutathione hydrolase proenzyme n=1 Tax=Alteribacillus iranensis TaxID=930128 RepID=A0A1I2F2E0_9BACI|nr:gamma-glutamyltransferase [Alteribacillus iranensis]SFE99143.1 gamma-glutamyltransferase 2. Threonine peptidase. MEROPS family T03 [Alteribacillus iranensis]